MPDAPQSAWPMVPDLVRRGARLWGGREAAVGQGRRANYATLASRSFRLGSGLRLLGIDKGDRVAFIGDNSLEYLESYFGVPAAELVLLPLNTRLAGDELAYIFEDSGCRAVIAGPGFEDTVEAATADMNLMRIGTSSDPPRTGWTSYQSVVDREAASSSPWAGPMTSPTCTTRVEQRAGRRAACSRTGASSPVP